MRLKIKLLLFFYRLGIVTALLIAFSGNPHTAKFDFFIDDYSNYLFTFSVSHMILLILIGVGISKPYHVFAGTKIQTAGYLHTLIGFSAALFQIDPESFSIFSFIIPIGSALVTSIIGWFVGGEIVERYSLTPQKSMQNEVEKVAVELEGFAKALRVVHEEYINTVNEASKEYKELNKKQTMFLKRGQKLAHNLENIISPLSDASVKFRDTVAKYPFGEVHIDFLNEACN
ncbi:hypothetical protein ACX8XP_13155 [Calditrichota bacterium LG25]